MKNSSVIKYNDMTCDLKKTVWKAHFREFQQCFTFYENIFDNSYDIVKCGEKQSIFRGY